MSLRPQMGSAPRPISPALSDGSIRVELRGSTRPSYGSALIAPLPPAPAPLAPPALSSCPPPAVAPELPPPPREESKISMIYSMDSHLSYDWIVGPAGPNVTPMPTSASVLGRASSRVHHPRPNVDPPVSRPPLRMSAHARCLPGLGRGMLALLTCLSFEPGTNNLVLILPWNKIPIFQHRLATTHASPPPPLRSRIARGGRAASSSATPLGLTWRTSTARSAKPTPVRPCPWGQTPLTSSSSLATFSLPR